MRILLFLFIALPIAEIFVLIQVGKIIGGLLTIALVILTALLGVWLLRLQGRAALERARAKMQQGTLPAGEMLEGLFFAVGGALLLTPGFITDAIGFCCLLPGIRRVLILWGMKQFVVAGNSRMKSHTSTAGGDPQDPTTIEGQFKRED